MGIRSETAAKTCIEQLSGHREKKEQQYPPGSDASVDFTAVQSQFNGSHHLPPFAAFRRRLRPFFQLCPEFLSLAIAGLVISFIRTGREQRWQKKGVVNKSTSPGTSAFKQ